MADIERIESEFGPLLPGWYWEAPEVNDEGLPVCSICHEPLIDFWCDDQVFHECPQIGAIFQPMFGHPYRRSCSCRRDLTARQHGEEWALKEKKLRLMEDASLPRSVSAVKFSTLDFDRNPNWESLASHLEAFTSVWTADSHPGAMLVGPSAAGKTTMLAAVAAGFIEQHHIPVRYFRERELLDGMRNRRAQTVSIITASAVVIIDDMGTVQYRSSERNLATQGELWDAITEVEGACASLIIASRHTLQELVFECGISSDTALKIKRLCPYGYKVMPAEKSAREHLQSMEV